MITDSQELEKQKDLYFAKHLSPEEYEKYLQAKKKEPNYPFLESLRRFFKNFFNPYKKD